MNETFGWVLILIFSTMGAILYLHSRMLKTEEIIMQHAVMLAKAAELLEGMQEEQERVSKILENYIAWEENDDGQKTTSSS